MAKVRVSLGLQHTNVFDCGSVEGENNSMDHDIIDVTNHTIISALDNMARHILAFLMIIVRLEGG